MSEIKPVVLENSRQENTGVLVVAWLGVASGDTCLPYKTAMYPDRSVQVKGTPSGALATMKGSNLPTFSAGDLQALKTTLGVDAAFSAVGLEQIVTASYYTAPVISGGDGSTDLDIYMMCVTARSAR